MKKLCLQYCFGIDNLSIPNRSKQELLGVYGSIPSGGSLKLETSSIKNFSYGGDDEFDPRWPFNFSLDSKKNLSELDVSFIRILDSAFDTLVSELSSIKIVSFNNCTMPQNISIRSVTLEQLDLGYCSELTNITLVTPQLKTFFYNSIDLQLSSVTSIHCICNACVKLTPDDKFDTQSLVRINGLLSRSKCWKVLSVDLSHAFEVLLITPY